LKYRFIHDIERTYTTTKIEEKLNKIVEVKELIIVSESVIVRERFNDVKM